MCISDDEEKVAELDRDCKAEATLCIQVHLRRHEWNEVQSLAEQFCHFPSLVQFCEVLPSYMDRFSASEVLCR